MHILKNLSYSLLLAFSLSACNNTTKTEGATTDSLANIKDSSDVVVNTEAQPADSENHLSTFEFKNVDNSIVKLGELKGKVVFVNFWATWCPPCIEEMPSIQVLYEKFKDNKDIVFLIVDVDGDLENANTFMKEHNLKMPLYIMNSNLPAGFELNAIPTTIVLDKQGNLDLRLEGGRDYATPEMFDEINAILAK